MTILALLIPASLVLALGALIAFVWTLRAGQYDDIEGAARRVLLEDGDDAPPRQQD